MKNYRKIIMKLAHEIKAKKSVSLGIAIMEAAKAYNKMKSLLKSMSRGIVSFLFINKEGDNRPANGLFTADCTANIHCNKTGGLFVRYYDTERLGLRAFTLDRFVGVAAK